MSQSAATTALLSAGKAKLEDTQNVKFDAASAGLGALFQMIVDGDKPLSILEPVIQLVENPDGIPSAPAAQPQIGAGTAPTGVNPQGNVPTLLEAFLQDTSIPDGVREAVRRSQLPVNDPSRLTFAPDGLPTQGTGQAAQITALENEKRALTTERDGFRAERDNLAAANGNITNTALKEDLAPVLSFLLTISNNVKTNRNGSEITFPKVPMTLPAFDEVKSKASRVGQAFGL